MEKIIIDEVELKLALQTKGTLVGLSGKIDLETYFLKRDTAGDCIPRRIIDAGESSENYHPFTKLVKHVCLVGQVLASAHHDDVLYRYKTNIRANFSELERHGALGGIIDINTLNGVNEAQKRLAMLALRIDQVANNEEDQHLIRDCIGLFRFPDQSIWGIMSVYDVEGKAISLFGLPDYFNAGYTIWSPVRHLATTT